MEAELPPKGKEGQGEALPSLGDARVDSLKSTFGKEIDGSLGKTLSAEQQKTLLSTLQGRFEQNMNRHPGLDWARVQARLESKPEKMWSLNEMERTGGEPDVVGFDEATNEFIFFDCSAESPEGRRNLVYDKEAEEYLKEKYPDETCNGNAIDMVTAMGIEILDETEYEEVLQKLGEFDLNTASWVKTPTDVRDAGVALFGVHFEGGVCVDPNAAYVHHDSRAFRGKLVV